MSAELLVVAPGPDERSVRTPDGKVHRFPDGWTLVPPGDAALTRRLKAAGPCWQIQEKKGRKVFSRGLLTSAATVTQIQTDLASERSTESYARKRVAATARRERIQTEYVGSFRDEVLQFLDFAPQHQELAGKLADAVTAHATPVGSGTVARTTRIPIERRAEAAVIAWMRHQTTAYDTMSIPRVKGKRREVRRELAKQSRKMLARYRKDAPRETTVCPIAQALAAPNSD